MNEPTNSNGITWKRVAGVLGVVVFAGVSFWAGNITGRLNDVEGLADRLDERTGTIKEQVSAIYDKFIVRNVSARIIE